MAELGFRSEWVTQPRGVMIDTRKKTVYLHVRKASWNHVQQWLKHVTVQGRFQGDSWDEWHDYEVRAFTGPVAITCD